MKALQRRPFRGALVKKAADQTGADYTAGAVIAWDAESSDTDGFHDTVTNNSRLIIPANKGITRVRVGFQVSVNSFTALKYCFAILQKSTGGGAAGSAFDGTARASSTENMVFPMLNAWTPSIPVIDGDYFHVYFQAEVDTAIDIQAGVSWFAIEVVG